MAAGKFWVRIQAVPHQASDTAAIAKAQALLFADKAEAAQELLRSLLAARPKCPRRGHSTPGACESWAGWKKRG